MEIADHTSSTDTKIFSNICNKNINEYYSFPKVTVRGGKKKIMFTAKEQQNCYSKIQYKCDIGRLLKTGQCSLESGKWKENGKW